VVDEDGISWNRAAIQGRVRVVPAQPRGDSQLAGAWRQVFAGCGFIKTRGREFFRHPGGVRWNFWERHRGWRLRLTPGLCPERFQRSPAQAVLWCGLWEVLRVQFSGGKDMGPMGPMGLMKLARDGGALLTRM
jgi:hypothetical protein